MLIELCLCALTDFKALQYSYVKELGNDIVCSFHSLVVTWQLCGKEERLLVFFHKPYSSFRWEIPESLLHYFVSSEMMQAYCPLKRKTCWSSNTMYRTITRVKLR